MRHMDGSKITLPRIPVILTGIRGTSLRGTDIRERSLITAVWAALAVSYTNCFLYWSCFISRPFGPLTVVIRVTGKMSRITVQRVRRNTRFACYLSTGI